MQWLEHTYRKIGTQIKLLPDGYSPKEIDANKLANAAARAESKLEDKEQEMLQLEAKDQEMIQLSDNGPNEYLINVGVIVENSGLSDMQIPMSLGIANNNVQIVSSNKKGDRLFEVEPLKSRESKTVHLTLKVKDDQDGTYSRELQDHKDGLKLQFLLNEYGSKIGQSQQSLTI